MSNLTLRLGSVDRGSKPADPPSFFMRFHAVMSEALQKKFAFRDEGDSRWRPFEEVQGTPVSELQQFLKDAGFMPNAKVDGIFGYVTHAAVRLFQEYLRTVEGKAEIGTPDGLVGRNTYLAIEAWKASKAGTPGFVCQWAQHSPANSSEEFNKWIALLAKAKQHYLANPHPILQFLERRQAVSDSRKVADWETSPNTVHLIGIRRNQDAREVQRTNDDLFVLLINGMVFKFWGSTDPSEATAREEGRSDEPFLIEGQHLYKFGWHKVGNGKRVYRALRPAQHGVMVFRDRDNTNALTEANIAWGLDDKPNGVINIHWSGRGHTNYSAGCQVIAGKSYINPAGQVVDCSAFASPGYDDLDRNKTRGAYNMLTDLILCYSPAGVQNIAYTLCRDETFFLADDIDETTIEGWLTAMR